jgi:hypothetical protein
MPETCYLDRLYSVEYRRKDLSLRKLRALMSSHTQTHAYYNKKMDGEAAHLQRLSILTSTLFCF